MKNEKEKYSSLFSPNQVDTNLFKQELKNYIEVFKNELFNNTLKDIYFQECDTGFYYTIFEFIKEKDSINFENCHFYFRDITHDGNSIFKDSSIEFKDCTFRSGLNISPDVNYPDIQLTYYDCTFLDTLNIQNINSSITFNDCSFNDIELKDCNIKNNIFTNKKDYKHNIENKFTIDNCTFKKRFTLNNYNIKIFTCTNCVFKNKFEFKNNNVIKFEIHNSNFEEISDMYSSEFTQFKISKSIFHDFSGFENCVFGTSDKLIEEVAEFEYVTFKDILTLRKTKFMSGLDIENINLQNDANFLKTRVDLKNTPRETFRLIKHSFDKVGNIIEANRFYELEMRKKEEDLGNELPRDFLEWVIFKIHGFASEHSQNALMALFWIFIISYIYSYLFNFLGQEDYYKCILEEIFLNSVVCYVYSTDLLHLFMLSFLMSIPFIAANSILNKNYYFLIGILATFLYVYLTKDFTLSIVSNNINPFSIITEKGELNFPELLYRVTIAYLIYQSIISIRQNTRRK